MTVSSQTSNETFNGNGVTTVWDLPFRFFENTDIFAYLIDPVLQTATPLALGTDYTLTGAGLPEQFGTAPGKIITTVAVAGGKKLYVKRVMDVEQNTDIINQGRFFPEVHEDVFDRLTMLVQQLDTGLEDSLKLNAARFGWDFLGLRGTNVGEPINPTDAATKGYVDTKSGANNTYTDSQISRTVRSPQGEILSQLPAAISRANKVLGFDALGNPQVLTPSSGSAIDLANDLANGTDSLKGSSLIGYNANLTGSVGRTVADRLRERVSILDFGVINSASVTQTALIQAALTATCAAGKTLYIPNGFMLKTGALSINATNGGSLFCDGACYFIPAAANTTIFTVTNTSAGRPFLIDGIGFDNLSLFTGCTGLEIADFVGFHWRNIVTRQMGRIAFIRATAAGPNAYNMNIDNVMQFGKGSFVISGEGTKRVFDVHIRGVSQFTGGGDTWEYPWFQIKRGISVYLTGISGQSLGGLADGVDIQGQCEGVFLTDVITPWPKIGVTLNLNNGDTIPPAWVYLENIGIDQPQVNGMDVQGRHIRVSNLNITGGTFRLNTGVGMALRSNARNFTMVNSQVTESHNSGLLIENGAKELRFSMCDITGNHVSGTGVDLDCIGQGPRDPDFKQCIIGTRNLYTTGQVINGGSTSRYVYSSRAQQTSAAGSSGTLLDGFTLPAGSFVDTKTIRITASGAYAANANAKAVQVLIGGVVVATLPTGNGVAWMVDGEVLRIDANNTWQTGRGNVGTTSNCSSVLQTPFNSSSALSIELRVTGTAAADVIKHHFDIELID